MKNRDCLLRVSAWILCVLLMAGCKRDKDGLPHGSGTDIHIWGVAESATGTSNYVQWVNEEKEIFEAGFSPDRIRGFGRDIYVLGELYENGVYKIVYFKNGVLHKLEVSSSSGSVRYVPQDIAISGGDVYIAGEKRTGNSRENGYFKNTQWHALKTSAGYHHRAVSAMTVTDGNIYIAGFVRPDGGGNVRAAYWKNTTDISILNTLSGSSGATDIRVVGGKVYIAGVNGDNKACYWIDGVRSDLPLAANMMGSEGVALVVQGTDVLVAGYQWGSGGNVDIACYWKNGQPAVRMQVPEGSDAIASGIGTDGNDIYISGQYNAPSSTVALACYWKNGAVYKLSDTYSETWGIAVVKK